MCHPQHIFIWRREDIGRFSQLSAWLRNVASSHLFTFRNYVNNCILRNIYFAIFDSHINYANLIWDQNINTVNRIVSFNFEFRDSLFSLETLTQVHYSNPTIFWNLKIKYADLPSFMHLPHDFHAYFFIHAFMHALRTSKWLSRIFLKKT